MTLVADPDGDYLDALADRFLSMDRDKAEDFLVRLDDDELQLVETALARRVALGFRATPATLAEHLTTKLDEETGLPIDDEPFLRYRYADLLAEKFVDAVEGRSKRQIWMLPARYGKTLIASLWGPVWMLDRYPRRRLILTSYGDDLARENSGAVRDLGEAHAADLSFDVRRDLRARDRWSTAQGGRILAAGVDSAMTGFGGDLIVVDDPFKNWVEAHSEANREKVWNWYRSVVRLRLQRSQSAIIIVGTRWHEDDLVGRILKEPGSQDEWEVIRLPAVAEAPDERASKWWEKLPDPLGREPGEVLEPERFDEEEVASRAKDLGPYLTGALEQQRPSAAEGTIFKRGWWKFYGALPNPIELTDYLISWDMAFKDTKGSSYCVGQVWARIGARRYLLHQVRDLMDFPTARQSVKLLAAKYPQARRILIEDKANGTAIIQSLKRSVSGIIPITPTESKEARAHAVSGTVEAGDVWIPDPTVDWPELDWSWVPDYLEELSNFPNGAHDDQVDATTQALNAYDNSVLLGAKEDRPRYSTGRPLRGRR